MKPCRVARCDRLAPEPREICVAHFKRLPEEDRKRLREGLGPGCSIAYRVMRNRMAERLGEREHDDGGAP